MGWEFVLILGAPLMRPSPLLRDMPETLHGRLNATQYPSWFDQDLPCGQTLLGCETWTRNISEAQHWFHVILSASAAEREKELPGSL